MGVGVNHPTAQEVRELRLSHRFTRAEFAQLVYTTVRVVAYWEQGRHLMPISTWELLQIKILGIPPEIPDFAVYYDGEIQDTYGDYVDANVDKAISKLNKAVERRLQGTHEPEEE